MNKDIFIDDFCGDCYCAIYENEKLVEFFEEGESADNKVGSIYKGEVINVLNGMSACFINCGLAKSGYLSSDDIFVDNEELYNIKDQSNKINLKVGTEVMVQVVKQYEKGKGVKLTTAISYVGKNLIYYPDSDFISLSKKIENETQRKNLYKTIEELKTDGGFIIRTVAVNASTEQLKTEMNYLRFLHITSLQKFKLGKVGDLIYKDTDLPLRILREYSRHHVNHIYAGNQKIFKKLMDNMPSDAPKEKIILHNDEVSLFEKMGIIKDIENIFKSKITLDNGASIVIERTEAMTVIDVNSQKYIGEDSLEDTVYNVNLLAVDEIARQITLRNIGGIIIVDFIDMTLPSHKKQIVASLTAKLKDDKAKARVYDMTELGLVQITRRHVNFESLAYISKKCECCNGSGIKLSLPFILFKMYGNITKYVAEGNKNIIIKTIQKNISHIIDNKIFESQLNNEWKNVNLYLCKQEDIANGSYKISADKNNACPMIENAVKL